MAGHVDVFETHFATPQSVDIAQLCGAHGIDYREVADWSVLAKEVATLPDRGVRVLELRTDRKLTCRTLRSMV